MNAGSEKRGHREGDYISAMSRDSVVKGYAKWTELSDAEALCFNRYLPRSARVLDLGCGTGRAFGAIGNRCLRYLGLDASEAMVHAAKLKYPKGNFSVSDIVALDTQVAKYNVVLLLHNVIDMLQPLKRRKLLLAKVYNILSSDGVLIASSHLSLGNQRRGYYADEYHGVVVYNYRSSLPEWCEEVEKGGFEILMAMRDFRARKSDWCYVVARKVADPA